MGARLPPGFEVETSLDDLKRLIDPHYGRDLYHFHSVDTCGFHVSVVFEIKLEPNVHGDLVIEDCEPLKAWVYDYRDDVVIHSADTVAEASLLLRRFRLDKEAFKNEIERLVEQPEPEDDNFDHYDVGSASDWSIGVNLGGWNG